MPNTQVEELLRLADEYADAWAIRDVDNYGTTRDREVARQARAALEAHARALAQPPAICGHQTAIPVDADLIGCGKPIATEAEVFRCTDCGIPFHRECAKRHFETDTPENAQKVYAEQLRRLDASATRAQGLNTEGE